MAPKMTVYSHFPDKPALLSAVSERNREGIRLPDLSERSGLSPLERLCDFGERLVGFLTRPEIVRTGRVMAASADDFPALAAAFYAGGPERRSLQARALSARARRERGDRRSGSSLPPSN